jgi:hypothetical protein
VNPSGLIYATIVVLWAAVLVPMWLRRHDEVTESRSVDRFQGAMRTLSRRPPTGDRREVLVPRRGETHAVPDGASEPPTPASVAAARRRRVGLVLLAVAAVIGGLVALHRVPVWAPAVPAVILLAFTLRARASARKRRAREFVERRARAAEARRIRHEQVARTMGRTDRGGSSFDDLSAGVTAPRNPVFVDPAIVGRTTEIRRRPAAPAAPAAAGRRATAPAAPGRAPAFVDPAIVGRTAEIRRAPVAPAVPAAVEHSENRAPTPVDPEFYDAVAAAAWDPVPVPLPTYVSAPKAPRSVRIVDLTKPGAWTSGRLPATPIGAGDAEGTAPGAREEIVTGEVLVERRAVGD